MKAKKTNKKAMEVNEQVVVDPFEFGYKEGVMVNIPGALFGAIMQFAGGVAQNEIKERFLVNSFSPQTGPQIENGQMVIPEEQVQIFTTHLGKQADMLFQSLMNIHQANINSGTAVKYEGEAASAPELSLD